MTVVDEGNFTRAAKRLHVAQPSLSKQLSTLEAELGGQLIERMSRGIRLTSSGKAFLPEARAATLAAERARRAARTAHGLSAGELEIATVMSIAIGLLPTSIRTLRERHPGLVVRLHEFLHGNVMADAVRGGVADIAVGPRPADWDGPVVSLGYEEMVVILPEGDVRLEAQGPVRLQDLADRDWVLPAPDTGLAALVADACRDSGFTPRPTVHSSQVQALARLAASGLGPTMLPRNVLSPDLEPLSRALDRPIVRELAAYTRSSWAPVAEALLETLWDAETAQRPRDAYVAH